MPADIGQAKNARVSNDGSQTSTFNDGSEQENIKAVQYKEEIPSTTEEHYPAVLESAPFPVLGSLEEITQTLSRVKSNQTQSEKNALDRLETNKSVKLPTAGVFKQEPYHTDGIRNPGWLTVLSCFLVNFFVFGTCFSWGNYQKQ